ncbi:retrovirus-related pol polyprotein from transposon TNT 1-94 [Tanacetum coccineum]|uniref:Retrovirus-related pol polyprotein from transposon TNT 1-94 n=1 Tax=Tanacetum coccineum TaxID=301880 RepID=A0ABQ4Y8B2_9ASTR
MSIQVTKSAEATKDTQIVNETLTAKLERYKERVKLLEERQNVDLNSREKYIDSQMNDIILHKNAKFASFEEQINTLKQNLSKYVKENESLMTSIEVLKKQTKAKENKVLLIEYNETLELKAQLAKKEHMVEKTIFNELVLRCSCLENHCVNIELKLQHKKESFLNNRHLNNQDAPEIQEFFQINEWQAKLKAKDVSIANLKKHIESLKGKNVVEKDVTPNNVNVIALGMFKLDLEPLSPKLLKTRDVHIDYIKHTQEHADTLREIVEHARALRHLDSDLDSACRSNHPLVLELGLLKAYGRKMLSAHQLLAFSKYTCYIRDLEGVNLLKGSRGSNLYTLSLEDMMLSSPICLLSKASKTKYWLWHRRLSHLNFDYITTLAKQGLVRGLPKLKFKKDHLCSACALGKSKKHTHKPKAKDFVQENPYLLHIDLCRPMKIQSINGKKYILVIVDDYSRFTWVKYL